MKLISKLVYQGLKRKHSNLKEANRLGLTLNEYKAFKRRVLDVLNEKRILTEEDFQEIDNSLYLLKSISHKLTETHHNVEKGTSKLTAISSTEPKTPEEIISILGIDTTKWKLSQYWNKEQNDKWLVSALITRIDEKEKAQKTFLDILANTELKQYDKIDPTYFNSASTEKVCGVISLQDLHFGKPGNENMREIMKNAILYLVGKAYKNYDLEKVILVVGPDTLNMDTFDGTTTKGTSVHNSELATDAYVKAFDALCEIIGTVKHFCKKLEVVFIPGNHDRLSSFHMLHAISHVFKLNLDIVFNVDYSERKVLVYGQNMFAFEHGDVSSKNNPLVYAVEFAKEWGTTKYRTLYTGHYHGRKTKEVITEEEEQGFVTRIIPALTSSDYYHYHNKWTNNTRSAIIHIHEAQKGLLSEFVYVV